ncbi:MAG: serine hydrolase domain-containing protein, partial [Microthrixaceae bacterium]
MDTPPSSVSATGSLPAELVAELDAAATASLRDEVAAPGAIVGVRTPQGTWTAAYGEADPATGAPMEVGMHTRIGSITKTFTGTALLQLAQAGELSLDDTIGSYVDGVPNGDEITLRQLATMTSGVQSYTKVSAFTDEYFAAPETVFDADELITVGLDASPVFDPGEEFDYSNTNTLLLGKVIEQVSGLPLAEVFATRIIEPLGLANT